MALGATLKAVLTLIADALTAFAVEQGWNSNEYRILFHVNPRWGRIRVFFIAKDFGGASSQEIWTRVWDSIEKSLNSGPEIGYSIGLSVRDWDQVNQGGAYSIPPGYIDYKDLLLIPSVTD
jgi:hypothetical protein